MDEIADVIPQQAIDISRLPIPQNLPLADPSFYEPSQVDLLLGAGIFYNLICTGQLKLGLGSPVLQETQLGWIVSGPLTIPKFITHNKTSLLISNSELQNQLERFRLVEENYKNNDWLKEEIECETDFMNTFKHDSTGRFEINLPVRENYMELGNSLGNALIAFIV